MFKIIEKYIFIYILFISKLFSINASNTDKNKQYLNYQQDKEVKGVKRKLIPKNSSKYMIPCIRENPKLGGAEQNKPKVGKYENVETSNKSNLNNTNFTTQKAPRAIVKSVQLKIFQKFIGEFTDVDLINKITEIKIKYKPEMEDYRKILDVFRQNNINKLFSIVNMAYMSMEEIKKYYPRDLIKLVDSKSIAPDLQIIGISISELLLLKNIKNSFAELAQTFNPTQKIIDFDKIHEILNAIFDEIKKTYNLAAKAILNNIVGYIKERKYNYKSEFTIRRHVDVARQHLEELKNTENNMNDSFDYNTFFRIKKNLLSFVFETINQTQLQFSILKVKLPQDIPISDETNSNDEKNTSYFLKLTDTKQQQYVNSLISFLTHKSDINFRFEKSFIVSFLLELESNNNLYSYLHLLSNAFASQLIICNDLISSSSQAEQIISYKRYYQQILESQALIAQVFRLFFDLYLKIVELNDEVIIKQSYLKIKVLRS